MLFMLDIETTGLDKEKDDVLQIAALGLAWEKGLFVPALSLSMFLPTRKEPSEYGKNNPVRRALYEKCHDLHQRLARDDELDFSPEGVRARLIQFLGPKAHFLGLNITTFDLKFLEEKGYLREDDYHYQVFDMTGVIEYVTRLFDLPRDRAARDSLKAKAKALGASTVSYPTEFAPHEGLYDCYDQTAELNGFLIAGRGGFEALR